MKRLQYLILGIFVLCNILFANERIIYQKDFENKTIYIDVNSYKVLQFEKRVKTVEITNSENIIAELLEDNNNPLTRLKIYAKEASNESALITFQDNSIISVGFNIVPHLKNLIFMAESTFPGLKIEQINDTIFLKGNVANQKDRDKILDMFLKFDIDPEKKVVDMLSTSNPKMIRIKLYAVEIDNDKGLDIKNNWTTSSKNYSRYTVNENRLIPTSFNDETGVTTYTNKEREYDWNLPLGNVDNSNINDQYSENVASALDSIMGNAVSLTGGLSGAANFLSKYFNTSLTLQYLADEGVANVLDESTLVTLENKEAKFMAGGEIYVRLTSDEKAELRTLPYGLELTLTAKEVMNNEFVHLNIITKSREIDWNRQVDGIPPINNKSINTTVIIKNKATIVLGGLINNANTKDIEKVPLLGDIPVLGALFKSSSFKEGKSELVFFITPEIVQAVDNNQIETFKSNKKKMFDRKDKAVKQKYLEVFNLDFDSKNNTSEKKLNKIESPITKEKEETSTFGNLFKTPSKPKMTPEEAHQKRVNEILGY